MQSIKKSASAIQHDSTRRASLPLVCLDTCLADATFSEFIKKLRLSPVNPPETLADNIPVPRIVLDNSGLEAGISTSVSPSVLQQYELYPRTSSPFPINFSPHCRYSFSLSSGGNETRVRTSIRRASCGPNFPIRISSDSSFLDGARKCSKTVSPQLQTKWSFDSGSPNDCPSRREKSSVEDSQSSNRSLSLRQPSLSPCFEDKAKACSTENQEKKNACFFSFKKEQLHVKECANDKRKGRRASFHAFTAPSPRFPHAGVYWSQNFTNRSQSTLSRTSHESNRNQTAIDNINIEVPTAGHLIGKGGFGVVKVGFWRDKPVAVKMVNGHRAKVSVVCENNALQLESHPNIVTTYAVATPTPAHMVRVTYAARKEFSMNSDIQNETVSIAQLSQMFGIADTPFNQEYSEPANQSWMWIVSELCTPTNLLKIVNSLEFLKDRDLLRILQQIAMGLNHIHRSGLVHLDVKPSNCFVTPSGNVKLGDYGCLSNINEAPSQVLGTVVYQAPEILKGEKATDRCDIFSFAVTAWQLLTLETPYKGFHPHVVIYKVTRMQHRPSSDTLQIHSLVQKILHSIIERCWSESPQHRPSADSLCRILESLTIVSEKLG